MATIRIGLFGLGNIGSGLYRLLSENGSLLREREQADIDVARVLVRDPGKARQAAVPPERLTTRAEDILDDPDISIVVEMMGGAEPARTLILEAIRRGKSVVTANKEVVATHWDELQDAARAHGVGFHFEASVAGGIPIIRAIRQSLQGNRIERVMGIINGTTNFILTRMSDAQEEFGDALAQAQRMGYAEPDPTADIEGHDARFKLAILASLCFGRTVRVQDIHCEGITRISADDIACGRQLGFAVKLLAIARQTEQGIEARVHPAFLPLTHPLAAVRDANNAIFIHGNAVGDLMFYGRGAGDLPTASALVSDVLVCAREAGCHGAACPLPLPGAGRGAVQDDWLCSYYAHLTVDDHPGVLAAIAGIFGRHGVSLESVLQQGRSGGVAPLVFVTHPAGERAIRSAMDEIAAQAVVQRVDNLIRVER